MTDPVRSRWHRARRLVHRRRRAVAAALTFVSVLFALSSVASALAPTAPRPATGRTVSPEVPDGFVAAPVRLSDPAVAGLVAPGDVVDVVAADAEGQARTVAAGVVVVSVPTGDLGAFGPESGPAGLVVVAVAPATGVSLAAAAVAGPLSLLLHR